MIENKKIIIILVICAVCGLIFVKKFCIEEVESISMNDINDFKNESKIIEEKEEYIKIHIYGEVKNPGLVELKVESRIYDAIQVAGGTTEMADIEKVNLAYILSDGEKIYIPSINDLELVDNNYTIENKKININIASKEQLENLNGVGPSLAESIVEYREKNGKFSSIEDIKNVPGIGDSKFNKIEEYISVK